MNTLPDKTLEADLAKPPMLYPIAGLDTEQRIGKKPPINRREDLRMSSRSFILKVDNRDLPGPFSPTSRDFDIIRLGLDPSPPISKQ